MREYLAHCRNQCGSAACDVIDEAFSNGCTFNNEQLVYIIISVKICLIITTIHNTKTHNFTALELAIEYIICTCDKL